ncbi:MAG: type III-A CRISPR-associated protein Cas10/Csm1 [Candidatus Marinimicrobia bacterium]|nr:type III-A CRISPR-associated protein Cas10/Csm1 [Candidatus Neomarinimicrobiota bacterium]
MNKQEIYLAGLFHDIGKLIERSKIYDNKEVNKTFSKIRYSHAKYTAFFLSSYFSKINWIKEDKENILKISAYHHNPQNFEGRLLQFADWLASSERVKDEKNTMQYNTVQLRSIFGTLNEESHRKFYPLMELDFENLLPDDKDEEYTRGSYNKLSENMLNDLGKVKDKDDLYYTLQKYFSLVPAQTTKNDPDISLFDHSKLTSAIAVCLYLEYENNKLDDEKLKTIIKNYNNKDLSDEHFILINGDLSGIQDYIFNIPSKGAAKSLKGRSTYIILLMEAISNYIINQLGLEKANIIYNGGGNFYILAPKSVSGEVANLRNEVNQILFDIHSGKIFCNIEYADIKLYEFKNFKDVWKRVSEKTGRSKLNKLNGIWEEKYEAIFEPKGLIKENNYCSVCHSTKELDIYDDSKLCSLCYSMEELTKQISKAKSISIKEAVEKTENTTYKTALENFGYVFHFSNKIISKKAYILNEFGNNENLKWKLGAFNLPLDENKNLKTFNQLAENGKLAYLKLDVDNLGKLFISGLVNPSLSRMSTLSRFLKIFFEGFLPNYIKELGLKDEIYILFSGGDDTFLIGSVKTILDFSSKLRAKFNEFVCGNSTITFSAGIGIFRYNFPIVKATQITEQLLENAKELVYPEDLESGNNIPRKDKVTILDEVFTWNEFEYLLELFHIFKDIVNENSSESRGILQKLINSTKGFKPLLDSAQRGELSSQRIWRLRYFLRDVTKDTKDRIIKIYEKMWMDNLYIDKENKKNEIKNHQLITVAAKLADLQTRK